MLSSVQALKLCMQLLGNLQLSLQIVLLMLLVSKLCLQLLQSLLSVAKLLSDAGSMCHLFIMPANHTMR